MIRRVSIYACIATALAPCIAQSRDTSPVRMDLQVQSCDFNFTDAFSGVINKPNKDNNFGSAGYSATIHVSGAKESFGFDFTCYSQFRDLNEVATDYGGHFEPRQKKWISDFPGAPADEASRLREVTKTFPLNSKNGHGFYTIQDETIGEPYLRMRHISYCLFHGTKAVCGNGQVKRLVDAKSDMLPYALSILRSVEFTDASPETGKTSNP